MVSEKGQVTIPKSLRERLGIKPGQMREFEARQAHPRRGTEAGQFFDRALCLAR